MTGVDETAISILSKHPLCDYCLGRQFARISTGLSNRERGRAIKLVLLMDAWKAGDREKLTILAVNAGVEAAADEVARLSGERPQQNPCSICGGRLSEETFRTMAEKIVANLAEYEYRSFLVGASVPALVRELDDNIRSAYGLDTGEDFKNDVTREVGKLINMYTGAVTDHLTPDITVIVNIFTEAHQIIPSPLFIRGNYLKHQRNIPQSVWHCRRCWGRGCSNCGYTGREYPTSVSEIIGLPAVELFKAEGFKFHAAGREDVDALVEGEGRPFVLELKRPRKRLLNLDDVERILNERASGLVSVRNLRYASRREMRELKITSHITVKTYSVGTEFEREVDQSKLLEVENSLRGAMVEQWTPSRVLKRRGEKLRRKLVHEVKATQIGPNKVNFTIRCQGGLYVKELITGDGGRTKPSVAEMLDNNPVKIELTVVGVEVLG
ncbi:MAG: tRNA pseudouridine(54/55) synthase Pus10 [Nitrososphaerota archaeon]